MHCSRAGREFEVREREVMCEGGSKSCEGQALHEGGGLECDVQG